MPVARKDSEGLTPQQRQAARMEVLGIYKLREIADAVGVHQDSLSTWRRTEEYKAFRQKLNEKADALTSRQAAAVRVKALQVVTRALMHAEAGLSDVVLDKDPLTGEDVVRAPNADEVTKYGRMAHDVYKTTSAQTGVVETSRTEIVDPAAVVAKMRRELADATEEELERLADDD